MQSSRRYNQSFRTKWHKSGQFGDIPERCAKVMDAYFKANYPKYFVVSDKGNCTASWGPQAKTQSIKTCQEKNQTGCRYLN